MVKVHDLLWFIQSRCLCLTSLDIVPTRRGIALKVMGKRKAAVSHYQMALDLDPESIDARVRWSNVLMEQWAEQRTRPGAQQLFSDALALVQSGLEIDRLYPGLAARHAAMLRIKEAHDKEHLVSLMTRFGRHHSGFVLDTYPYTHMLVFGHRDWIGLISRIYNHPSR